MLQVRILEFSMAMIGLGVYAEFLNTTVPAPLGAILALGLLPTGDIIRAATRIIDRRSRRRAGRDVEP